MTDTNNTVLNENCVVTLKYYCEVKELEYYSNKDDLIIIQKQHNWHTFAVRSSKSIWTRACDVIALH